MIIFLSYLSSQLSGMFQTLVAKNRNKHKCSSLLCQCKLVPSLPFFSCPHCLHSLPLICRVWGTRLLSTVGPCLPSWPSSWGFTRFTCGELRLEVLLNFVEISESASQFSLLEQPQLLTPQQVSTFALSPGPCTPHGKSTACGFHDSSPAPGKLY